MTGEEEGHDLVAQLLVGHTAAAFVFYCEQVGQQVAAGGWVVAYGGFPPVANQFIDHIVEMLDGLAQASAFGDGDAIREHESPIGLGDEEIHYDGHGTADAARVF